MASNKKSNTVCCRALLNLSAICTLMSIDLSASSLPVPGVRSFRFTTVCLKTHPTHLLHQSGPVHPIGADWLIEWSTPSSWKARIHVGLPTASLHVCLGPSPQGSDRITDADKTRQHQHQHQHHTKLRIKRTSSTMYYCPENHYRSVNIS